MLKKAIRLCSILLIIALFVNMLPMQAFAQMVQSSASAAQDSTVSTGDGSVCSTGK